MRRTRTIVAVAAASVLLAVPVAVSVMVSTPNASAVPAAASIAPVAPAPAPTASPVQSDAPIDLIVSDAPQADGTSTIVVTLTNGNKAPLTGTIVLSGAEGTLQTWQVSVPAGATKELRSKTTYLTGEFTATGDVVVGEMGYELTSEKFIVMGDPVVEG